MPSVSSCLRLKRLRAERVMSEQAVNHELLVAFHSVCTALCQCCACLPLALQTEANIKLY